MTTMALREVEMSQSVLSRTLDQFFMQPKICWRCYENNQQIKEVMISTLCWHYLEENQGSDANNTEDGVMEFRLIPRCDESFDHVQNPIGMEIKAKEGLHLRRNDRDGHSRRESKHNRSGNEINNETQLKEAHSQCDEARQES